MPDAVPFSIFVPTIGLVLALVGIVWNKVTSMDGMDANIASIKSDLEWIKKALNRLEK